MQWHNRAQLVGHCIVEAEGKKQLQIFWRGRSLWSDHEMQASKRACTGLWGVLKANLGRTRIHAETNRVAAWCSHSFRWKRTKDKGGFWPQATLIVVARTVWSKRSWRLAPVDEQNNPLLQTELRKCQSLTSYKQSFTPIKLGKSCHYWYTAALNI